MRHRSECHTLQPSCLAPSCPISSEINRLRGPSLPHTMARFATTPLGTACAPKRRRTMQPAQAIGLQATVLRHYATTPLCCMRCYYVRCTANHPEPTRLGVSRLAYRVHVDSTSPCILHNPSPNVGLVAMSLPSETTEGVSWRDLRVPKRQGHLNS